MRNKHSMHRGNGNQAVAESNDTQREGPVEPGPRHQRGPSKGEGRAHGRQGPKHQKQYQKTRHYAYCNSAKGKNQGLDNFYVYYLVGRVGEG